MADKLIELGSFYKSRYGTTQIYTDLFLEDLMLHYLLNVSSRPISHDLIKRLFWEFIEIVEGLEFDYHLDGGKIMMCGTARTYYAGFLIWAKGRMTDENVFSKELREFRKRVREIKKYN